MKSPHFCQTVPMGRMIALALATLGMAIASPAVASVQATYYVSPSGNDSNPGTEALPFHTIAKARDVVRTVNTTMTGDIVVQLRGGTYPLTSTLTFGKADGGNNGYDVRYMNYTGEKPLLTGGQPITGWTISDAGKNIWKATGVKSRFRQLYVNGTKAIRARNPNLGTDGSADFYRLVQVDKSGQTLQVESSRISNWNNFTKAEMHLMQAWGDDVLRLASITASGSNSNLAIQDPEGTIMFNRPYPMLGSTFSGQQQCYYFENAYELLDQPGEWYLDESANTLYYIPRTGEDMTKTKVVVPQLETLVSVGGPSTSQTVGYMSFQGLAFAHSTYMRPSQYGFLDAQAGQYNVAATLDNKQYIARPPAGIVVSNAHHIRFEGNLFAQMAATGLDFVAGTHDDAIVGNVVTDIGGNGISIGKFTADETTEFHIPYNPSDRAEICTNDTIRNNLVTKVTTEMQGAIGIAAGYPRYLVLEHNEISYTNYSGISVGYGWSHSTNAMAGNKINWNNIHHITQIMADAGGIYTLSNQEPNSQIQYNYLHDYGASQWADYGVSGIYLDEGTGGYDISHNVFANAPSNLAFNGTSQWNTASDNDGNAASTISGAGIEAAYADIKNNLKIPLPNFGGDTVASDGVFNGTFDLGTTGWTFNTWGSTATGSVVGGEYKIQIDKLGTANSSIQLVQNGITLEHGKSYVVTFDAYASAKRTLEANAELDVSPWTSYLPALQSFNLTTTKATYSYTFTMTNSTDLNGRVSFNAGASTETVYLDNISIKGVTAGIRTRAVGSPALVSLENSRLKVEFGAVKGARISLGVYDLKGKQVRTGSLRSEGREVSSWSSDLSGMPRGLYIVKVDADGREILRSKLLYGN